MKSIYNIWLVYLKRSLAERTLEVNRLHFVADFCCFPRIFDSGFNVRLLMFYDHFLLNFSMQAIIEVDSKEPEGTGTSLSQADSALQGVETNRNGPGAAGMEAGADVAAKNINATDETDGKVVTFNKDTTQVSHSFSKGSDSTPQKSSRRSGSHVKRQNSKGRVDISYQLSPDLQAVTVDLLANKYGGKEKANRAAKVIQEYYRHWVLSRSFRRVRAYSEKRKKSYTQIPEYPFNVVKKLSQTAVYDIENPVLIVDLDDEESQNNSAYLQTNENSRNLETEVEVNENSSSFLKTMSRVKVVADEKGAVGGDGRKILIPSDAVFYQGTPRESKVEREIRLGSSVPDSSAIVQDGMSDVVREEQKEEHENGKDAKKVTRTESTDSYEIIDGIFGLDYRIFSYFFFLSYFVLFHLASVIFLIFCHILSCFVLFLIFCHILVYFSYFVISCHILSYFVIFCHILPYLVILCHILSYLVISCHIMSHLSYFMLSFLTFVVFYLILIFVPCFATLYVNLFTSYFATDVPYFAFLAQQYFHVISRNKGDHMAESLSSISSDTIDETNDSRDESASIFYDDDHYPPTVDKSKKWRYRIGINLFNRFAIYNIKQLVEN